MIEVINRKILGSVELTDFEQNFLDYKFQD